MFQKLTAFKEEDILQFVTDKKFPYTTRIFFIQHLVPYVLISDEIKNRKVLEIGIGDGFGSFYLSKFAKRVAALDLDFTTGSNLKKYIDRNNLTNINFINANALFLPFKDNSFDSIISCQVIEHISEDKLKNYLGEIKRVLKYKSAALIATLNVEHNIKNPKKYEKFPQHHKEFNKKELIELLRQNFDDFKIFALNRSLKHNFFLRLKRWGFLQYGLLGKNPVINFYNKILPCDYRVSSKINKNSIDLIAICTKN